MRAEIIFTDIILFVFISHAHCTTNVGTFYTGTVNKRVPSPFLVTTSAVSAISCCMECEHVDTCNSVSYHTSNSTCLLSTEPLIIVNEYGQASDDWITYSKDDWKLVFRGTPGAGGDIYHDWYNGASVTTDDVTCMTTSVTSCSKHYRHPIVDSWTSIGVKEVKVAYYKDNEEGDFITFDATGSDVLDWFSPTRILNSSWPSLKSESFERFSIEGHAPSRRMLIVNDYVDCLGDAGYTIAVTSGHFVCDYDKYDNYPQFLYSDTDTYGSFQSEANVADVFAIFIK